MPLSSSSSQPDQRDYLLITLLQRLRAVASPEAYAHGITALITAAGSLLQCAVTSFPPRLTSASFDRQTNADKQARLKAVPKPKAARAKARGRKREQ